MPLDKDRLGSAINDAIDALSIPAGDVITPAEKLAIWKAVADEIVKEFTTNGTVPFPIAVTVHPSTHIGGTTAPGSIL